MHSRIIKKLKEEERIAFLKLEPADRILTMERLLYEIISIKAIAEGMPENEIYNRYISRNKKRRHAV